MQKLTAQNQAIKTNWLNYLIVFFFLSFLYGCGSVISASTVKLSADVGSRITEMEKLHQLAIQRYFDLEEQKIEDFLTKTWEPLFLKNFLGESQVLQLLQNVSSFSDTEKSQIQEAVKSYLTDTSEAVQLTDDLFVKLDASRKQEGDEVRSVVNNYVVGQENIDAAVIHINSLLNTDEPAQIIFDFAEDAHNEMNKERQSLLAPLNQLRQEAAAELSAAYAELIRGQSTITGRLEAAAKVSEQQDQLLSSLGIKTTTRDIQAKLSGFTSKVDGALNLASGLTDDGSGGMNLADKILNTLKSELNKVSGK